jgi:ABC-2 type transport system ATP-binding protein
MKQAILKVTELSGGYTRPVLHNLNFDVSRGEIVALLGLNGAGKSTTMKHILGLLTPMKGTITLDGLSLQEDVEAYRKKYAYIPESPVYYPELTLWEHLEFTARVHEIEVSVWRPRAEELLLKYRMQDSRKAFPQHFSKGMRQKLMIMMAFLVQPPVYLIDEPILGLDPLGIRTLFKDLNEAKSSQAGILMSTHILASAERFCDRFLVLHQGRLVASGTLEELREQVDQRDATLDEIYLTIVEGCDP